MTAYPKPALSGPALDVTAFVALETLVDHDFATQVAMQFAADAASVLVELDRALKRGDGAAFADHLHALRSGAANVGATSLFKLCLAWRDMDDSELAVAGAQRLAQLHAEFARACAAMETVLRTMAAAK